MPGLGRPFLNAGTPVNGTNEVQRLTIGGTPTGGTFKLKFDGLTTGAITWSATNNTLLANIQAALDALPNAGTNGIVATAATLVAGIGTIDLTFGERLAKLDVPAISVPTNNLTGTAPTLAITVVTPGVTATGRGSRQGQPLIDTTTGIQYVNTSSNPLAPTWSQTEGTGGVGTADLADGVLSADAAGRAKLADDFFNAASVLAKFDADSFTNAVLLLLVQNGAFAADSDTRALFADGFLTGAKLADGALSADATGRAKVASDFFDAATATDKFAVNSFSASAVASIIAAGAITKAKTATFVSTEQTATGSAQNVAHGLGAVPSIVMVAVTEHPGTPDTGAFDVAEGAHDDTNVIVTVTADVKFKIFCWA